MKAQRFTVTLKATTPSWSDSPPAFTAEEIEQALRAYWPNVLGDRGTHALAVKVAR